MFFEAEDHIKAEDHNNLITSNIDCNILNMRQS